MHVCIYMYVYDVPVAALDNWQPVWNAHGVNFNTYRLQKNTRK